MDSTSPVNLSLFQRFLIRTRGYAYVEHRIRSGWRAHIPFYAFKCKEHGIVVDYPHSHKSNLTCPKCTQLRYTGLKVPNL